MKKENTLGECFFVLYSHDLFVPFMVGLIQCLSLQKTSSFIFKLLN